MDPVNVLKRGYTITRMDGKVVKRAKDVKDNQVISTTTVDGEIFSIVIKNQNTNEQ